MDSSIYNMKYDFIQQNGHYLVFTDIDDRKLNSDDVEPIQLKMLSSNTIPKLLPLKMEDMDFNLKLHYDITSKRMLTHFLKEKPISMQAYYSIIINIITTLEESKTYMINEGNYILRDDFIFIGKDVTDVYLTYLPLPEIKGKPSVSEDLRELLMSMAGEVHQLQGEEFKQVLNYLRGSNFSLTGLKQLLTGLRTHHNSGSAHGSGYYGANGYAGGQTDQSGQGGQYGYGGYAPGSGSPGQDPAAAGAAGSADRGLGYGQGTYGPGAGGQGLGSAIPSSAGNGGALPDMAQGRSGGKSVMPPPPGSKKGKQSADAPAQKPDVPKKLERLTQRQVIVTIALAIFGLALTWKLYEMNPSSTMLIVSSVLSVVILFGAIIYMFLWRPGYPLAMLPVVGSLFGKSGKKEKKMPQKDIMPNQLGGQNQGYGQSGIPGSAQGPGQLPGGNQAGGGIGPAAPGIGQGPGGAGGPASQGPGTGYAGAQPPFTQAPASHAAAPNSPNLSGAQSSAANDPFAYGQQGTSGGSAAADGSMGRGSEPGQPDSTTDPSYNHYKNLKHNTALLSQEDNTTLLNEQKDAGEDGDAHGRDGAQHKQSQVPRPFLSVDRGGEIEEINIDSDHFVIGRNPDKVQYVENTLGVSRAHLEIIRIDDSYGVKDLGSKNGTKLNEEEMVPYKTYVIRDGDELAFGKVQYTFQLRP
jgi:hypothetical protein